MREQIRTWTENFETFVLEVIFEQRKGKRAAIMRGPPTWPLLAVKADRTSSAPSSSMHLA